MGLREWISQGNEGLHCQFVLLKKVIADLELQEDVFLILDRVDLCQGPTYRFIAELQSLINCSSYLKIMITMSMIFDKTDRVESHELLSSKAKCCTFGKIKWDQ